ncbi:MAG: hypothetical protein JSR61_08275 [Proteobacteria bacterium]|nr:hypothetical protein [Pseudomonadota bacterium]
MPHLKVTALALASLLPVVMAAQPAAAANSKEKMETCKFGADNDNLTGAKRTAFIKKCMANANYEPQARKDALKQAKSQAKSKKPAAAKPGAMPPPPGTEEPKEKAE